MSYDVPWCLFQFHLSLLGTFPFCVAMFTSTPTILCTSLASYNPVPNQVAKSTTSQQTTALPPTNAQTQTDNSNEIETQTDVLPIEPFVLNEKRGLQAIESLVSKVRFVLIVTASVLKETRHYYPTSAHKPFFRDKYQ